MTKKLIAVDAGKFNLKAKSVEVLTFHQIAFRHHLKYIQRYWYSIQKKKTKKLTMAN